MQESRAMDATQEKAKAIKKFWSGVEKVLKDRYGHNDQAAKRGIQTYRDATNKHNQRGTVYNQGEDQTASVINGLIKHKFRIPKPT
jgi:hypothetical protein